MNIELLSRLTAGSPVWPWELCLGVCGFEGVGGGVGGASGWWW